MKYIILGPNINVSTIKCKKTLTISMCFTVNALNKGRRIYRDIFW